LRIESGPAGRTCTSASFGPNFFLSLNAGAWSGFLCCSVFEGYLFISDRAPPQPSCGYCQHL
jgi:hypothetical protein